MFKRTIPSVVFLALFLAASSSFAMRIIHDWNDLLNSTNLLESIWFIPKDDSFPVDWQSEEDLEEKEQQGSEAEEDRQGR